MKNFKKIILVMGLGASSLLASCGASTDKNGVSDYYDESDEYGYKQEKRLEKEIVDIIEGNGVKIYLFDVQTIDVFKYDDGYNYLVLGGESIYDLYNGREKTAITYNISDENAANFFGDALLSQGHSTYGTIISNDHFACQKYGRGQIRDVRVALADESTTLYSIKNLDKDELVYTINSQADAEMANY
ncbi:MAG: hypothetical protein IJ542_03160 [Clostridia bacterium]|nr:hypothetical protein [Clostridia bacterium]